MDESSFYQCLDAGCLWNGNLTVESLTEIKKDALILDGMCAITFEECVSIETTDEVQEVQPTPED